MSEWGCLGLSCLAHALNTSSDFSNAGAVGEEVKSKVIRKAFSSRRNVWMCELCQETPGQHDTDAPPPCLPALCSACSSPGSTKGYAYLEVIFNNQGFPSSMFLCPTPIHFLKNIA